VDGSEWVWWTAQVGLRSEGPVGVFWFFGVQCHWGIFVFFTLPPSTGGSLGVFSATGG
jgi:hypothetical protein